jgi:uncharacterized protein YdaU (DUF1376 family)
MESNPGGIALHHKATGHKQWTTPEAYKDAQMEKFLKGRIDREVNKKLESEVQTAVEVALRATNARYKRNITDIDRKHQAEMTAIRNELSDSENHVSAYRFVIVLLLISLAASWLVLAYFAL